MHITPEMIGLVSFCVGTIAAVWRASSAVAKMQCELRDAINRVETDLTIKDLKLQNLQEVQVLSLNGFRKKIEHFIARTRGEIADHDRRLDDLEAFLTKTTDFVRRR